MNELLIDEHPPVKHPIAWGFIIVLVFAILIGSVAAVASTLGYFNQTSNAATSNRSSEANQRNAHCVSVQGVRWRRAQTHLTAGIADIVLANRDPAKVAKAQADIRAARVELAAVERADRRLDASTDPLCPYVPGHPERTPDTPQ